MKRLLCLLLSLPLPALAWEPVNPDDPSRGFYVIATIGDLSQTNLVRYVSLAGVDMAEGCRLATRRAPDAAVNEVYLGRFMRLGRDGGEANVLTPIVLFARAHNARVLVRVVEFNRVCSIDEVRTCFEPASCP